MVLVTGATGMVGGNLIWHLLQKEDRIYAIRRSSSNLQPLKSIFNFYTDQPDEYLNRIDWIIADVMNENLMYIACKNKKIVYHCAAVVSLGNTKDNLSDINVLGTRNIVNACIKNNISKLCFVSSIAACGSNTKGEIITEDTIWEDTESRSAYSKSKYYSEQEVWKGINQGLNAIIVNPGVILGVSGTFTGSSELFYRVRKGLPFYTKGGSGYIDVRDVVKIMISLTNSELSGERFILTSVNCSNKEILSWIAEGLKKHKPFIYLNKEFLNLIGFISEVLSKTLSLNISLDRKFARTASKREYYSNAKIIKYLGYQFIPVEKSINDICKFIMKE